jgi:phosphate transport system protein
MDTDKHILKSFDSLLVKFRDDSLLMASLTERNLRNAMQGLLQRDSDLCNQVIVDDEEIDLLEKQVDQNGIALLVRFQPLASDLRRVISTMKLVGNLERIGDQAVSIAKRSRKLNKASLFEDTRCLEPMFNDALAIFKDSIRAFVEGNIELALSTKAMDKHLDEQIHELSDYLTSRMGEQPERIPDFLNLILIARNMERVGDLAKNIAEDAVYAASAEDIRHPKWAQKAEPSVQ